MHRANGNGIALARSSSNATVAAKPAKRRRPRRLLWTARQLGRRLQVHERTVLQLARDGLIPCIRLSGKLLRFEPETCLTHFQRLSRESIAAPTGEGPDGGLVLRGTKGTA